MDFSSRPRETTDLNMGMIHILFQVVGELFTYFIVGRTRDLDIGGQLRVLFPRQCCIHGFALCRQPIIFYFPGYWSSVVRLGHLFEGFAFKMQFRAALCQVITDHFLYRRCVDLPAAAREWSKQRFLTVPTLANDRSKAGLGFRLKAHMRLRIFDNGDPSSADFVHWCTGDCCEGSSETDKSLFALCAMCENYCTLYNKGYSAPLTYRWKGADAAQDFIDEAWRRHICFRVIFHIVVAVDLRKGIG